ncbi:hypothetical protein WJ52_14300 [Burkholderia ubonensis]|nr:hypothetical protein WJ52_14300 [Burkholderia ubonensis]
MIEIGERSADTSLSLERDVGASVGAEAVERARGSYPMKIREYGMATFRQVAWLFVWPPPTGSITSGWHDPCRPGFPPSPSFFPILDPGQERDARTAQYQPEEQK